MVDVLEGAIVEAVRPGKGSKEMNSIKLGASTQNKLLKSKVFCRLIDSIAGNIVLTRGAVIPVATDLVLFLGY